MSFMQMQTLTLIRGLPGSGKSTLAYSLAAAERAGEDGDTERLVQIFEADDFFINTAGDYEFNPRLLSYAHAQCLSRAAFALKEGVRHVIVANTFTTWREVEPYHDLATAIGEDRVRVQTFVCRGKWENNHNVPEKTIERMRERWEEFGQEADWEALP
jgi:predicted kinase